MRVAIFGGTGFVGSYICDAMIAADIQPVVLVRTGHGSRLRQPDRCIEVTGDIGDAMAVDEALGQADAAIYNIGILREFPARDITYQRLQLEAPRRVIDSAARLGVRRFLLMSANGVNPNGTPYQRTKHHAEQHLAASGLDGTVFRPSVIFGDPRGRSEFATQLMRDVIDSALPAPLFYSGLLPLQAGNFRMSPVHVSDVARAFVSALLSPDTIGRTLCLGGPEQLSWRQIIERLAAVNGRRKLTVPVPAFGVSTAARLLDRFESFPVTRDQLQMLLEGNTCTPNALRSLGIDPVAFDKAHLDYLAKSTEDGSWQRNAA
jgi:NADH dehydrogenase